MKTTTTYRIKLETADGSAEYTFLGMPTTFELVSAITGDAALAEMMVSNEAATRFGVLNSILEMLSIKQGRMVPVLDGAYHDIETVDEVVTIAGTRIGSVNTSVVRTYIVSSTPTNEALCS